MNRWKVRNINYRVDSAACRRLRRSTSLWMPWIAQGSITGSRFFATHAEAITYADKQARRTT